MLRPEPFDFVIILLVALLFFGPKRLPETARAIGKAIHEFRDGLENTNKEPKEENTASSARDSHKDQA